MKLGHLLLAILRQRLVVLGALAMLPSAIGAQVVVRTGRASLQIPVSVTIPVRLKVAAQAPAMLIERTADYIEVELPLTVAANVAWRLRMDARDAGITVRTVNGEWVPLTGSSVPAITGRREATEPSELRVRLRMPAGRSLQDAASLRVSLEPADGN